MSALKCLPRTCVIQTTSIFLRRNIARSIHQTFSGVCGIYDIRSGNSSAFPKLDIKIKQRTLLGNSADLNRQQFGRTKDQRYSVTTTSQKKNEFKSIYTFKNILVLRMLNRLKNIQLLASFPLGMLACNLPDSALTILAIHVSVLISESILSVLLSHVIGQVSVNESKDIIHLSYLDFWGRKVKLLVHASDVNLLKSKSFYSSYRVEGTTKTWYLFPGLTRGTTDNATLKKVFHLLNETC